MKPYEIEFGKFINEKYTLKAMYFLTDNLDCNLNELSIHLGIKQGQTSQMIKKMVGYEVVSKKRVGGGRSIALRLTLRGVTILEDNEVRLKIPKK